jgi:ubiquinone/menaquinone biosynthesis C-methylase UbiE
MEYDKLSKRIFAAWYDLLNSGVESRVVPYRRLTAGLSLGRTLEIGGGTGANISFYPPGVQLITVEPNPHMSRRFISTSQESHADATVVSAIGENLPFADATFDSVVTTLTL